MPINIVHDLGRHGSLQACVTTGNHFAPLRQVCAETPFNAIHSAEESGLSPALLHLFNQSFSQEGLQFKKGVDCYFATTKTKNNEQPTKLKGIILDQHICLPPDKQTDRNEGVVAAYIIVHNPKEKNEKEAFYVTDDHGNIQPPHVICSSSPGAHAVAQIASVIPMTQEARVIFDSPNLGALYGIMLKGEDANLVKNSFINLVKKTEGMGIYDVPIKFPKRLADILMLRNPEGMVCCAKIQNGIVGYRTRKEGGKTFIFVCNSNDFNKDQPDTTEESILQLFKFNYVDPKKEGGQRIHVKISGKEEGECKYNTPPITLDMTVQDVLNTIEFACRHAMLDNQGCAKYPIHFVQAEECANNNNFTNQEDMDQMVNNAFMGLDT